MVKKEDILLATRGGLDVYRLLWEDAARIIDRGEYNKPFKIRLSERSPSAHLRLKGDTWIATDFGGDQQGRNCFDWVQKEMHLSGFKEACAWIVTELNLDIDDIKPEKNKPLRIEKVPSTAPEKSVLFEVREGGKFTKRELEVFGDLVTQEVMDDLHWLPLTWVGTVKDGMMTKVYGCDDYPIYARECVVTDKAGNPTDKFHKIYKPLEFNKQYRFMVSGVRPNGYINGLYELRKAYSKYKTEQEKEFDSDPRNEDKTFEPQKFKAAVMASGERDAAAVRALGQYPIWLNSESDELRPFEENIIKQCVETLYNIPDKDSTGINRGRYHALRHPDMRTIWLPSWFERYVDNRKKKRKDFKDCIELCENARQSFQKMMDHALPATFWTKTTQRNGKEKYEVNSVCLLYFLGLQGFHKLRDKESGETIYVRIRGNVVERSSTQDMREFLKRWAQGKEKAPGQSDSRTEVQPIEIQNLIIDSPKCNPSALENVDTVELDFTAHTPDSQYFFFKNGTAKVTGHGIEFFRRDDNTSLPFYVWDTHIIQHDFRKLDSMFTLELRQDDADGSDTTTSDTPTPTKFWTVKANGNTSNVMGYLINSSRLYWRKEIEDQFNGSPDRLAQSAAYLKAHHFEITSPQLNEAENRRQMQTLANKLFTIGYFGWGHKDRSRAYAAYAMDWKIDEMGECNGGTGKSFLYEQVLPIIAPFVKIDGRERRIADNQFKFSQVTRYTRMVLVDDIYKDFPFDIFYSNVTGGLSVNPKNLNPFTIPFKESPKFAFTTNYVPRTFDASTERRMLYNVSSDYYHTNAADSDEYNETRAIRDDFGKELFGDEYTEDEWNADINLLLQCVSLYIRLSANGIKIQPPMDNIILRSKRMMMADKFFEWAQEYFAPASGNLDRLIKRDDAINDFRTNYNMKDITSNAFFRKMRAFCDWCSYTEKFNPDEYCAPSKPGHIIRRETTNDGTSGKVVEWLYVQSNKEEIKRIIDADKEMEEKLQVIPTESRSLFDDDKPF